MIVEIAQQQGVISSVSYNYNTSIFLNQSGVIITERDALQTISAQNIETLWEKYRQSIEEMNSFISTYAKNSSMLYDLAPARHHFGHITKLIKEINMLSKLIASSSSEISTALQQLKNQLFENYLNRGPYEVAEYLFNLTYKQYQSALKPLFANKKVLAQVIWLKCLNDLTNCVDISIKSLSGSTQYTKDDYSDALDSQKTQFLRFQKLLQENYVLLKTLLCLKNSNQSEASLRQNKIFYDYVINLINRIDFGFSRTSRRFDEIIKGRRSYGPNTVSELMASSANFNVAEQIVGAVTAAEGLARVAILETGDDILTVMHQNALYTLGRLNLMLTTNNPIQYNPFIQLFMNAAANMGGYQYFARPNLTSLEFSGKSISLTYNVVLNNHSATLYFMCNKDGKQCDLTANFFGMNNERDRWGQIEANTKNTSKAKQLRLKNLFKNNDHGVSSTWDIPTADLTETGLQKYLSIFQGCVSIANGR